MANSLSYARAYLDMLDRIYRETAVTNDLTAAENQYRFSAQNAQSIYLRKMSLQGLGAYTRDTGYDTGTATVTWESHTFGQDRSKKFQLDAVDATEAMTTVAELGAEFMRCYVVPEIDAYRFHKITSLCSVDTTATLTYDTVMAAIRAGVKTLNDAEVPRENRILYVSSTIYQAMQDSGEFYKTINVQNNNGVISTEIMEFDGMPIKQVPAARFYTIFDFATSGAGGFSVNASGKAINFMIVYTPAIIGVVKHMAPKLVSPELNQSADGWLYAYRVYHDLFIADNKVNGVYIHSLA